MANTNTDDGSQVAQLVSDHYQKTFEATYDTWKSRNRTFVLFLLAIVGTSLFFTQEDTDSLVIFLSLLGGDEKNIQKFFNEFPIFVFYSLYLLLPLYLIATLYSRSSYIKDMYVYLKSLEHDIRNLAKLPEQSIAFTRESMHRNGLYAIVYVLLIIIAFLLFSASRVYYHLYNYSEPVNLATNKHEITPLIVVDFIFWLLFLILGWRYIDVTNLKLRKKIMDLFPKRKTDMDNDLIIAYIQAISPIMHKIPSEEKPKITEWQAVLELFACDKEINKNSLAKMIGKTNSKDVVPKRRTKGYVGCEKKGSSHMMRLTEKGQNTVRKRCADLLRTMKETLASELPD